MSISSKSSLFRQHRPFAAVFLGLLMALTGASPAQGQSVRELREENQALRTELADMTAEMTAATAEIARLRSLVAELRTISQKADTPPVTPATPVEPGKVTVDETKPGGSPRALLAALKTSYAAAMKDLPRGEAGTLARTKYLQTLEKWARVQERGLRQSIQWRVRITKTFSPADRGRVQLMMQAIDPVTGTTLGLPFRGTMARGAAARLIRPGSRVDLTQPLELKATMQPQIIRNEQRPTVDAFDFPLFIGPFAEFGVSVDVVSLTPPKPVEEVKEAEEEVAEKSGGKSGG